MYRATIKQMHILSDAVEIILDIINRPAHMLESPTLLEIRVTVFTKLVKFTFRFMQFLNLKYLPVDNFPGFGRRETQ